MAGLRAAVLSATTGSAAGGLAVAARGVLGTPPAHASVDLLVAAAVLATGALAAAVLFVGSLLLVLAHLTRAAGRSARAVEVLAARCTPVVVRRVVAVGLGAGLGLLGPAGLANATDSDLGWVVTTTATQSSAGPGAGPSGATWSAPGPQPLRSTAPPPGVAPAPVVALTATGGGSPAVAGTSAESADGRAVTVQPGDSLWSIAARDLSTGSPARIASEWPRWYAQNRGTIGDDPDLIRPGQLLVAPARTGESS